MKKCGNLLGFRIFLCLRLSMLMNLECGVRKQECGITVPGAFKSGLPLHFQERGGVRTGGHAGAVRGDGGGESVWANDAIPSPNITKKSSNFFIMTWNFYFWELSVVSRGTGMTNKSSGLKGRYSCNQRNPCSLRSFSVSFSSGCTFPVGVSK